MSELRDLKDLLRRRCLTDPDPTNLWPLQQAIPNANTGLATSNKNDFRVLSTRTSIRISLCGLASHVPRRAGLISHKVFLKSFCKSRFPHKSIKLNLILVILKDQLTDLWGVGLLQNDFKSTVCEIRPARLGT